MLALAPPARTAEALPSGESVRELLRLMQWRDAHEIFLQNLDPSLQVALRQIFHPQDESQEKAFAAKAAEFAAKVKEALSPEKVESIYIDVYRKNLTRQEVEDMIAFYSSETGRSLVAKNPLIIKQVGEAIQPRVEAAFFEQVRRELRPFLRRLPSTE